MTDKFDKIINSLDKLTGLYEGLNQEYIFLNAAVKRIENEILPRIEKDIADLKADVGGLKADVRRIEQKLDGHIRQPAHV